jgi:GNAT superfamily N-acetyltransferase
MSPSVLPGVVVPIEPARATECVRGDVVLVRRGAALAAHRWIGGEPGAWILQGDAFDEPDAPVTDEQVLGRASALLVGRWAIPLPSPVRIWASQRLMDALPTLRRSAGHARTFGRTAVRRAQRAPGARALRGRLQRCAIERFEVRHLPLIRAVLLRRSERPTRATLDHWERLARSEREAAFVAIHRGRIVGHASLHLGRSEPDVGTCGFLWVDRWYRGLGLARELEGRVVEHARALQYGALKARARWGSDSMRAFQRLGFAATRAEDDPAYAELRLSLG